MNDISMSMFANKADYWQARAEAAERQLAEAREVLKFYSCDCQPGQCENGPLEINIDTVSCGYRARAALGRK